MPRLLRPCFKKNHWGGRGAGTPAPQLPLRLKNLVGANFAASKNKKEDLREKSSLKIIFLW